MTEMESEKSLNKSLVLAGLFACFGFLSLIVGSRLIPQLMLFSVLLFFVTNNRYIWVDIISKTFLRDVGILIRYIKIMYKMWMCTRNKATVAKVFKKIAKKHPQKTAFLHDNNVWTYEQVSDNSNRVANYFKQQGFKKGDSVALYMENCVDFICIWLGLSEIGVVTALINTNLRAQSLLHAINKVNCRGLIFSSEFIEAVNEVNSELEGVKLYYLNANKDEISLKYENLNIYDLGKGLAEAAKSEPKEIEEGQPTDKLMYIFTSGTTGLPKAAIITNLRYLSLSFGVKIMLKIQDDDVVYNPLPLYHTSGVGISVGQALTGGTTVVIRKKFSASNFWQECIKYNCTVACYIGEICRYLLAVPEKPHDKQHKIRLMYGNGLRPQIWKQFVERFEIKQIGEFYGATEGNSSLINTDNKVGCVGSIPRIGSLFYPVVLIKVNEETEEPIRNSQGYCIRCKPGEPGMLIGKIMPKIPINAFAGYADKESSEKKILRNVFSQGDQYFNSGDILVMDVYGYFSFKDRTGDTYRWKGENVATAEVEAIISNVIGLKDAIVYGVQVPRTEGKAGMVAILDTDSNLNLQELEEKLRQMLPTYAKPLFLRVTKEVPLTGTYKHKKKELQAEGFNINLVQDPIYFYDSKTKKYELITTSVYNDILNGIINL